MASQTLISRSDYRENRTDDYRRSLGFKDQMDIIHIREDMKIGVEIYFNHRDTLKNADLVRKIFDLAYLMNQKFIKNEHVCYTRSQYEGIPEIRKSGGSIRVFVEGKEFFLSVTQEGNWKLSNTRK